MKTKYQDSDKERDYEAIYLINLNVSSSTSKNIKSLGCPRTELCKIVDPMTRSSFEAKLMETIREDIELAMTILKAGRYLCELW